MKKLVVSYSLIIYFLIFLNFKKSFIPEYIISAFLIIQLVLFSIVLSINLIKETNEKNAK